MADVPKFPETVKELTERAEAKLKELTERLVCGGNPGGGGHCLHPRLKHGEHGPYVPVTRDVILVCCWCGRREEQR